MKKLLSILLITIYGMATFGMSVKQLYCCGNLKSVSIAINIPDKEKNEKQTKDDGCCKTKYQSFKVKDNHVASDVITLSEKHFVTVFSYSYNLTSIVFPVSASFDEIQGPPLLRGNTPLYIFNCVFRI
jgi:hypothetical protein